MRLDQFESIIAREVLEVAQDIAHERRKQLIKAIEVAVQNGVAKAFGNK